MGDLRTLAQAVVDAAHEYAVTATKGDRPLADADRELDEAQAALADALDLDTGRDATDVLAANILAALDAADAQGYARAMGDVVERCESTVRDYADGRRWDTRIMGMCDEAEAIAEWASEKIVT